MGYVLFLCHRVYLWAGKLAFAADRVPVQNDVLKPRPWWKRPALWSFCAAFVITSRVMATQYGTCPECWPCGGGGSSSLICCNTPSGVRVSSANVFQPCADTYGEDATGCYPYAQALAYAGVFGVDTDYAGLEACQACAGGMVVYDNSGSLVYGGCSEGYQVVAPDQPGPQCCYPVASIVTPGGGTCGNGSQCSVCGCFRCITVNIAGDQYWVTTESDCAPGSVGNAVTCPAYCDGVTWNACCGPCSPGWCGGAGGCANNGGDADNDGCCDDVDCDPNNSSFCDNCGPCYYYGGDGDGDGCCAQYDCNDSDPYKCVNCSCESQGGDADMDGCCDDNDCDTSDPNKCDNCVCDDKGGDGDGDGCCADDDCDDQDASLCNDCPCINRGGDNDEDGCCGADDVDDDDPEVCDACERLGGDADGDGCCADEDLDDDDPERCNCDEEGGDADEDGCCDDVDSDPEDPEKGCKCECETDLVQRVEDVQRILRSWLSPPEEGGGEQWEGWSGIEIPMPGGGEPVTFRMGFDLSNNALPDVDFSWIPALIRAWCLLFVSIRFALAVKDVLITW